MVDYLNHREINILHGCPSISNFFNVDNLIQKLHNTEVLKGHDGCVNTLRWNRSGNLLASGSDDRKVIIWKGGREVHRIDTSHMGNIFAVEFLPAKNDRVVMSGAGDHMVMMHHIEQSDGNDCVWQCDGRVKRLATLQADPFLCWVASEDPILRQIDTRTNNCDIFISYDDQNWCFKSLAVSEAKPHLMALALENHLTEVPIFDRRNLAKPVISLSPFDRNPHGMYPTHVAFNQTATECVVNFGGGDVLVYDLEKEKNPKIMEDFHNLLGLKNVPTITPEELGNSEEWKEGRFMLQQKKHLEAIDYYGKLLANKNLSNARRSIFHSNRAMGFLARRQKGDSYACIRDCIKALQAHPGNAKAIWRMGKAMCHLENWEDAKKCCVEMRQRFPEENAISKIENALPEEEKRIKNHRLYFKDEDNCIDYKERYTGRLNNQTDIKEANFFGPKDQYIVAGSDCGSLMIWNRETASLVGMWKADSRILNCVQPHPELLMLATSGIDDDIRLWEPKYGEKDEEENEEEEEDKEKEDLRIANPYDFIEARTSGMHEAFQGAGMLDCRTS